MRVQLFTDSDRFAGTEQHIFDLACGLRQEQLAPCVACPANSPLAERLLHASIRVQPVEKRGLVDRQAIAAIRRLARGDNVDVVHAHNGRTALIAALALRSHPRIPLVVTQHFLRPDHLSRRGYRALISTVGHRWVNSRVARFIAISESVRTALLDRREAAAGNIALVPNGISDPDTSTLRSPAEVRNEFRIPTNAPLVVCVARLEPEKDLATLVRAIADVRVSHAETVCLVVGEGSERSSLMSQIHRLGLDDIVRLIGYRTDPLAIVATADLFVLPSLAEPFGLVVVEAMALGKAVVAIRAGGPSEIVKEGETGLLVPPGDSTAFAAAICGLLADRRRAEQLGQSGRERFKKHYTREQMSRATINVYEQALVVRK